MTGTFMENLNDGLLLIEAARTGKLPKVTHRLTQEEHDLVQSGAVFIWSENEVNIKRWTDGRNWSNSRLKGRFLIYKESKMEFPMKKKTLCARTYDGEKFHVICYYYEKDIPNLVTPSKSLRELQIPKNFYFVGGENSPLLQFNPDKREAESPTVKVAFETDIQMPSYFNATHNNTSDSGNAQSSRSISPVPIFSLSNSLAPLRILEHSSIKIRYRVDEEQLKILQSAIF
eukprot:NODE_164_length_16443_cov_0.166544.p8 type:complete len:230 gc:universal NODE_164_length_16443_cov_0.166544:624-1313(+)